MPEDVTIHEQGNIPEAAEGTASQLPPSPSLVPPPPLPQGSSQPGVLPQSPAVPPSYHRKEKHLVRLALLIGGIILLLVVSIFFIVKYIQGRNEKITLTWWGLWEDKNVMNVVIADFERIHPNISINYS